MQAIFDEHQDVLYYWVGEQVDKNVGCPSATDLSNLSNLSDGMLYPLPFRTLGGKGGVVVLHLKKPNSDPSLARPPSPSINPSPSEIDQKQKLKQACQTNKQGGSRMHSHRDQMVKPTLMPCSECTCGANWYPANSSTRQSYSGF